jgi:hypothetical protein
VHVILYGTAEEQSNGFRTEKMYKSHFLSRKEVISSISVVSQPNASHTGGFFNDSKALN